MQKRVVEPQADETRTESKVAGAEPSRGAPQTPIDIPLIEREKEELVAIIGRYKEELSWYVGERNRLIELAEAPHRLNQGTEPFREQFERLELMASGDDTWDLSDNDQAAIRAVLDGHVVLLEALKELTAAGNKLRHGDSKDVTTAETRAFMDALDRAEAAIQQAERT